MMVGGFDGFGGFGIAAILIFLVYLLFIGGIIWLLILAIRWFLRQERRDTGGHGAAVTGGPAATDPLEILRARYARGEIDDEEYERRRKTLTGG